MNRVVIAETFRRQATSGAYLAYLALLVILSLGVSGFNRPGELWPALATLLAFIIGSGPIGPELSSGTLQLILVKPVNRAVYLLSRVTGVLLVVWTTAAVCAGVELLGRLAWGDGAQAAAIGRAFLNVCVSTALVVSLLALLGSLTRSYFNIAIYMVALIGISILEMILAIVRQSANAAGAFLLQHPQVELGLKVVEQNLFPDRPRLLDEGWTLMVLSNAAVALVLACLAFRRREVPYGAD